MPVVLPRRSQIEWALFWLAMVWVGVTYGQRLWDGDFLFSMWSDRDLFRSQRALIDWPTTGAEMNYGEGARVPGGFYHYLLGVPLALGAGPLGAYRLLVLLEGLSTAAVGWCIARTHGRVAAAAAMLVMMTPSDARRPLVWLWNPTAVPLFVGAAIAALYVYAATGKRSAGVAWLLLLGLGGSAHATVVGWLVVSALAFTLVRPRLMRRDAGVLGLAAVAAWVPYGVAELFNGGVNTRILMAQRIGIAQRDSGLRIDLDSFAETATMLLPRLHAGPPMLTFAESAAWWGLALSAVAGLYTAFKPPADAKRDGAFRAVVITTCLMVSVPSLSDRIHLEWRYLLASVPGMAVIVGVGVARIAAWFPRAWGNLWVITAWVAAVAAVLYPFDTRGSFYWWATRDAVMEVVVERAGVSWGELAGRLVFVRFEDGGTWGMSDPMPFEHELEAEGTRFPGSQPGPCFALVHVAMRDTATDAERLGMVLGHDPSDIEVLDVSRVGESLELVKYVHDDLCQTNSVNRYIDTEEEVSLRRLWPTMSIGETRPVSDRPGMMATIVPLRTSNSDGRLMLGVELVAEAEGVQATLHSNQLRGHTYNGGWFAVALVRTPTLVFTPSTGEPVRLQLAPSFVGASGVVTPLSAHTQVPGGPLRVTLELETFVLKRASAWWPQEYAPDVSHEVVLYEAWTPPG